MVYRAMLAVSAILALTTHAAAQSPAPQVLELDKQYEAALNARDAAKVAALFAEGAVYVPPGMPVLRGPKAIQEHHAAIFNREMPALDATNTPMASELSGDLGLVLGEFVLRERSSSKDEMKGTYLRVWKRVSGQWRIHYEVFNLTEPPTPPTPPMPPTPPQ